MEHFPVGVVLAGGNGTRLLPMTRAVSKQLLPVFDKPMIYYPLSTLILAGVKRILIVCAEGQESLFIKTLGTGEQWGLAFSYATQAEPRGIPEALKIGEDFIGESAVFLILGDNLFHGPGLGSSLVSVGQSKENVAFSIESSEPQKFGVLEFDELGRPRAVLEKPILPTSRMVVPGLYFFAKNPVSELSDLRPSYRGELEIADLLNLLLEQGKLSFRQLPRGAAWFDSGTPESLLRAANYVNALQDAQGLLVGSPEETSWRQGNISLDELRHLAAKQSKTAYGEALLRLSEA